MELIQRFLIKYASDKIDDNQEIKSITNHAKCKSNSVVKESESPSKTKGKGRKRKEIVLQNDTIQKESKKIKKDTKTKKSNKSKENGDQELNIQNMLNEVPSVNDIFKDLGIDIKVENDKENIEDHEITENLSFNNSDVNGGISNKSSEERTDLNDSISRKTLNKLKLFEFKEKSDTSNLQRESHCVETSRNTVKKLDTPGSSASTSFSRPSISGSQISMFESSDCDIDLDI